MTLQSNPREEPKDINVKLGDICIKMADLCFVFTVMEKPARYKAKSKKPAAKPKTAKKRKSDGN